MFVLLLFLSVVYLFSSTLYLHSAQHCISNVNSVEGNNRCAFAQRRVLPHGKKTILSQLRNHRALNPQVAGAPRRGRTSMRWPGNHESQSPTQHQASSRKPSAESSTLLGPGIRPLNLSPNQWVTSHTASMGRSCNISDTQPSPSPFCASRQFSRSLLLYLLTLLNQLQVQRLFARSQSTFEEHLRWILDGATVFHNGTYCVGPDESYASTNDEIEQSIWSPKETCNLCHVTVKTSISGSCNRHA